jgi:hypothetical protein
VKKKLKNAMWWTVVDPHWFQCGSGSSFNLNTDPDPGAKLMRINADPDPGKVRVQHVVTTGTPV